MSMNTFAQTEIDSLSDTLTLVKEKRGSIFSGRPGRSLLFSLILPGSGQFYNKSYLRVPVVLAAVGGMGYLVNRNTGTYRCRAMAYKARIDGTPLVLPDHCREKKDLENITDPTRLRSLRDDANDKMQQSIIFFSLIWVANGVDAFVNAHLKDFDIDDDLSITIGPRYENDPFVPARYGLYVSF